MNKLVFADNYSARTSAGTQGIQRTNSHTVILGQEGDDSNFIGATDLDWNNDMAKKGGGGGRPPGANFPPKGGNAGDDRRRGPNNEGTKQGGNPGTKAGNGPWKTVGYKIPKVQGGSKGEGTGTSSENLAGKASADPPSKTLRGLWIREKRCLTCGSETHFRADCPLVQRKAAAPSTTTSTKQPKAAPKSSAKSSEKPSTSSSGPRAQSTSAAPAPSSKGTPSGNPSSSRGVKRQRDSAPSGATPPAKKKTDKKFSYAAAAACAMEMAIVTRDRNHIARREFETIRRAAEDKFIAQLDEGVDPIAIEQWSYTSHFATCHVADSSSAGMIKELAESIGFVVVPKAELEAERKPVTILTGLLTGPASKRERPEIERFLKFEATRVKIPGRIEFYSLISVERSGNKLLKIVVDDDAMERMRELDFQLRVGASGNVKFQDEREAKKSNKQTRANRIHDMEKEIGGLKERLVELQKKRRELEADNESVASLGLSKLQVESAAMDTEEAKEGNKSVEEEVEELLKDDE